MWKKRVWRILTPLLLMVFLCGIQTVVWPHFISTLAAPPLWLILIIWISLYRESRETILLVYALGFLSSAFTAMPLKMMLFSLLILYILIRRVRERMFWPSLSYFVMASLSGVAAFQVIYLILSAILEPVRTAWLPLDRLVMLLWSAPVSIILYPWLRRLEKWGQTDPADRERSYV